MPIAASSPHDIETLQRLLRSRDEMISKLMAEIARLRRWQFGRSSERMSEQINELMGQVQLVLGDWPATTPPKPTEPPEAKADQAPATTPADGKVLPLQRPPRLFPDHLPRETVVHAPASCNCAACGELLRLLGEDVSEMLDFVPGYFKVIRHVRPKLSCAHCASIVQEPAPNRPLWRAMAAAGLLAQVLVAKYADHTPLYRQEGIYLRSGVQLHRATMASWVREAAKLLAPLAEAVGRYVLEAEKIHTDDTPVPVLEPGRGSTRTARFWTYVRDDRRASSRAPPAVWYRYSPDRKGERPRQHLQGYSGILQADGYAGYEQLYADGRVLEAACWAHARRKFFDVVEHTPSPIASEAIWRIGQLYGIEQEVRGASPDVRRDVRQTRSLPLVIELKVWLEATLAQVSAKSELGKAIKYALGRWAALARFCDDGRIEMDNNTAEREIRPLVMGRKNYLFQGSDRGGEGAAVIYTLIGTARLNGIEPYAYIRAVLEKIADHPINRIDELLPWRLELDQQESLPQAA